MCATILVVNARRSRRAFSCDCGSSPLRLAGSGEHPDGNNRGALFCRISIPLRRAGGRGHAAFRHRRRTRRRHRLDIGAAGRHRSRRTLRTHSRRPEKAPYLGSAMAAPQAQVRCEAGASQHARTSGRVPGSGWRPCLRQAFCSAMWPAPGTTIQGGGPSRVFSAEAPISRTALGEFGGAAFAASRVRIGTLAPRHAISTRAANSYSALLPWEFDRRGRISGSVSADAKIPSRAIRGQSRADLQVTSPWPFARPSACAARRRSACAPRGSKSASFSSYPRRPVWRR